MFGFLKKQSLLQENNNTSDCVGYLGKLPAFADFIKYKVVQRESINFDHWLQDGYALYSRQESSGSTSSNDIYPIGFCLAGSEDDGSVSGVLIPSDDEIGRLYPFVVFSVLKEESMKKFGVSLLHGAWSFLDDAKALTTQCWALKDLTLLNQQINDIEVRLKGMQMNIDPGKCVEQLRRISLGELFRKMGIDSHQICQFIEVFSTILRGVSHRGTRRTHFGVRLPIGNELSLQVVNFWVHLITMMVHENNWRPQLYWSYPQANKIARLTIFFKPVPASYFTHIISDAPYQEYIVDLLSLSENTHQVGSFARGIAENMHLNALDACRRWSNMG